MGMKDPRRRWLLRKLDEYEPFDGREAAMVTRLLSFALAHENCCERRLGIGHVVTGAWAVDRERERALLVHHRKLERWLQPGGHVESDASLIDAARRELREETGLRKPRLLSGEIFDVDVHEIPAGSGAPAHMHHDVRFIFEASRHASLQVSEESHAVRWVRLDELRALNDSASLARLVEKTRRMDR